MLIIQFLHKLWRYKYCAHMYKTWLYYKLPIFERYIMLREACSFKKLYNLFEDLKSCFLLRETLLA